MAYQLVYTSAAKLLDAGRSGFGTVARSKTVSPLVVSAIERVSQFSNLRGNDRSRIIFVHRRIVAANNRFHLLSRICDAGADYTGRTHHIAHHLILTQDEVARAAARGLTPADVLRQFSWLDRWDGAARFFGPSDDVALEMFQTAARHSQRAEWARLTGNPIHARSLAWEGAARTGVLLVPRGIDALALMGEALYEFGNQAWSRSFTTSLETTDEMSDIDWVISSPEDFPEIQGRCGARTILDLGHPQSLPVPPEAIQMAPARQAPVESRTRAPDEPRSPNQGRSPDIAASRPVDLHPSSQTRAAARASWPAGGKKNQLPWLVPALVAIAFALLGAIAWKVLRPQLTEESALTAKSGSNMKLSPAQDKAVRDLSPRYISKKDAEAIINAAGPEDFNNWKSFVIATCEMLKQLSNQENPSIQSLRFPRQPDRKSFDSGLEWMEDLVCVVERLNTEDQKISLSEDDAWTKTITFCMGKIKRSINNYNLQNVESPVVLTTVETNLFLYFSGKQLDIALKEPVKHSRMLQVLLNMEDEEIPPASRWDRKKYPQSYKLITTKIRTRVELLERSNNKVDFETLFTELKLLNKRDCFQDDYKGFGDFKDAYNLPNYTQKNLAELTNEKKESIKKSALLPDYIKDLLKQSSGEPPTPTPPTNPDPANGKKTPDIKAQDKQVILVSLARLKEGVFVSLLDELLTAYPGNTLKKNGLTISIGDVPIEAELAKVVKQDFFSKSYLGKAGDIKIHTGGLVSIDSSEVHKIKLSYKTSKNTWTAIIVDEEGKGNEKPIVGDLGFNINDSGNGFQIVGTLADWIKSVKSEDKSLKLLINNLNSGITEVSIYNAMIPSFSDGPRPSRTEEIFPFINVDGIDNNKIMDLQGRIGLLRKDLEDYNGMLNPVSKPKKINEKRQKKEELDPRKAKEDDLINKWDKLQKDIKATAGRTFALKVLSIDVKNFDVKKITMEQRRTIIERAEKAIPAQKAIPGFDRKLSDAINADWKTAGDNEDPKIKDEQISAQSTRFFTEIGKSIVANLKVFGLDNKFDPDEEVVTLNKSFDVQKADKAFKSCAAFISIVNTAPVPIEERRKDFLVKITTLRVQTQKGRVLFEATRQN